MLDRAVWAAAAKAVGAHWDDECSCWYLQRGSAMWHIWEPDINDGDSRRIEVMLNLTVAVREGAVQVFDATGACLVSRPFEQPGAGVAGARKALIDRCQVTRLAVLLAAAKVSAARDAPGQAAARPGAAVDDTPDLATVGEVGVWGYAAAAVTEGRQ